MSVVEGLRRASWRVEALGSRACRRVTLSHTSITSDACELIVAFLGATRAASYLGRTCREWNLHVRRSSVWKARVAHLAPITAQGLSQTERQRFAAGEYSYATDWQGQLAGAALRLRFGHITNSELPPPVRVPQRGFFANLVHRFRGGAPEPRRHVVMVGLDSAGKSTILREMKLGEISTKVGCGRFEVETVSHHDMDISCWDVGGGEKIWLLWWRHFVETVDGVIFVVDANDRERIPAASEELQKIIREAQFRDGCLLVLANKQDMQNAMNVEQVASALGLPGLRSRQWCVQGTAATDCRRELRDAMKWLNAALHEVSTGG